MESLGSYIRSAARATSSAYKSVPIRWRLAGGSAALTLVILAGFAAIVGVLTTRQVRGQFNNEVTTAADQLRDELNHKLKLQYGTYLVQRIIPVSLNDYATAEHAQIRIYHGVDLLATQDQVKIKGQKTTPPDSPAFPAPTREGTFQELGYRVVASEIRAKPGGEPLRLLYARPLSDINHTLARVKFFLLLGVVGGTVLALLAGLATAQRAMRPIAQLTDAAREIERTRDPSRRLPHPNADDELAELARTLEDMLHALDTARSETEAMLDRQREFVADASHELRTPLTSVLANLELLADELDGEQAETAEAALRSTKRMRRLVGDLLLLARADARRTPLRRAMISLDEVLMDVAAEIGPVSDRHDLSIDAQPTLAAAARDDIHRMMLNLIENAVRHTPPGTHIRAATSADDGSAVVVVEDDGPGIPEELADRIFERFVRGGRDGGRGSGLGLSIVRAVAESHGGEVSFELPDGGRGTRFVVRIPTVVAEPLVNGAAQTSTTTGRTIGRRRSRS